MRQEIGVFEGFEHTIEQIGKNGLLLVAGQKGNPMTIGWGTIGIIWGKPVFIVLVRPSRYTFKLMEKFSEFSVNVPPGRLNREVAICGSKSGRDTDKIKECSFTLEKGKMISVPYIKECLMHYECRTVHKNKVIKTELDEKTVKSYYPGSDLHTIYFGEILGVYRAVS